MNDLFINILGGLAVIGITVLSQFLYRRYKEYNRFLPYKPIWKEFASKDTCIIMTGRKRGHTIKVSFNEVLSANRIQELLKINLPKTDSTIVSDEDFDSFKDKNIVVLGSEKVNDVTKEIMKQISANIKYSYTADNNLIINNEIFKSVYENDTLIKDFGLVVKTKNPFNSSKYALLFAGNHGLGTQASVQALTMEFETTKIVEEIADSHFYAVIESTFDKRFSQKPNNIQILRCGLLPREVKEQSQKQSLTRDDEIRMIMKELGANEQLIAHSFNVAKLAIEIGRTIESKGKDLDLDAIYYGAMLHDIGRVVSNDIKHALEGKNLLIKRKNDFIEKFYLTSGSFNKIIESVECHIVGGIKESWITQCSLKLPLKDYLPKSAEAKIVTLSDQILHSRREAETIFEEAPEKDIEILANLYKISEEIFQWLYVK